MPTSRHVRAMRELLGRDLAEVASLAQLREHHVRAFEAQAIGDELWREVSRRLDSALRAMGAAWSDADLHDGAHTVRLVNGAADDRRAIRAALALMGWHESKRGRPGRPVTSHTLAKRVQAHSRIPAAQVVKALNGSAPLPQRLAAACMRQLVGDRPYHIEQSGAGCYFLPAEPGPGWRGVGCSHRGCWW